MLNLPVGGGNGDDFKRAPSGTHIAVCNLLVDCGLQKGSELYPETKRKLYIRFEIPGERVKYEKDGEEVEGPITIGSYYNATMNEKSTLRKMLESWRGKKFDDKEASLFDVSAIVGKACMLSIVEQTKGDKTYSNIGSVSAMPKGIPAPELENQPIVYFDSDDHKTFKKLPKWLQEKVEGQLKPSKPSPSEHVAHNDEFRDEFDDKINF